jgi:hypothetical protein
MSGITIKLSVEEARALMSARTIGNDIAHRLHSALAAHEREEKRAALGLPWEPYEMSNGYWTIRNGRGGCSTPSATIPEEAVARLMAAAPDLAEACWEMLTEAKPFEFSHRCWELARAALKKANWP